MVNKTRIICENPVDMYCKSIQGSIYTMGNKTLGSSV